MPPELFPETRVALPLDPGAVLLGGFALDAAEELLAGIAAIAAAAPFRRMETPGGRAMSVAMTNAGAAGWTTSRRGYRYTAADPLGGLPWPPLPLAFVALAGRAAARAGFASFVPDACLVNRYEPGARMAPHQDRDEADLAAPIVSVSLGVAAVFLWGGQARGDRPRRVPLHHGDVVVWGGPARLTFHGVDTLKPGDHPLTGPLRYNLTFRKAL
ncbi:DNA oxidative demethylase AlkB [Sphingomonas profundi]|uniref:DNA oxidative demethylase AlkB n=1 Tax=Alterirhizorhabdus profundi TaxID=2681549 RepID=UPI0012E802E4|nr:DNA oxidative demethylase AlkB [Sphingomonas profundi]